MSDFEKQFNQYLNSKNLPPRVNLLEGSELIREVEIHLESVYSAINRNDGLFLEHLYELSYFLNQQKKLREN